ncbi:hypothetical protein BGZ91_000344, partial [Linnemannia elongata]
MKTHLSSTTSQPQAATDYTSSPPSSSQSTFSDWKSAPTSSSSTTTTASALSAIDTILTKTEPTTTTNYIDIAGQIESLEQPDIKPIVDAMVPSQSQAPPQPVYPSTYYAASEFDQTKSLPTQFNTTQYMAPGTYAGGHHPYAPSVQPAIHRRPSLMVGQQKHHAYPHSPPDSRTRTDYPAQLSDNTHQPAMDLSHSPVQPGLQDSHGRHGSLDSTAQHHLPPLTETLQRIDHGSPRSRPQPSTTSIDGTISSSYYPQIPLPGAPAVGSNVPVNQAYSRRVTYPFVPSIDTSSGLLMNSLTSPENSGSSPLIGSPFTHSSVVSANAVPVHGMVRSSPLIGYMDAMTLQSSSHTHPAQMSPHNGSYPPSLQQVTGAQQQPQGAGWFADTGLDGVDNGQGGNKIYSFVPISGVNSKKRPRRRFDEIER